MLLTKTLGTYKRHNEKRIKRSVNGIVRCIKTYRSVYKQR